MKTRKNNLDERQEQIMLKIEHNGCWLAFWGLLTVFLLESLFLGFEFKTVIGEWIVFMVLALYMSIACMKNGIWDRRLKPNFLTNLAVSLIAGVVVGVVMSAGVFSRYPGKPAGSIAAGVLSHLQFPQKYTKIKQKKTKKNPKNNFYIQKSGLYCTSRILFCLILNL